MSVFPSCLIFRSFLSRHCYVVGTRTCASFWSHNTYDKARTGKARFSAPHPTLFSLRGHPYLNPQAMLPYVFVCVMCFVPSLVGPKPRCRVVSMACLYILLPPFLLSSSRRAHPAVNPRPTPKTLSFLLRVVFRPPALCSTKYVSDPLSQLSAAAPSMEAH